MLSSVNHAHQNGNTPLLPVLTAEDYAVLKSCGQHRKTVRDDNRKSGYRVTAMRSCGHEACHACYSFKQLSELHSLRHNIDAVLAETPHARRYFLSFTLPACNVLDASAAFDELRGMRDRVRAVLGNLCDGILGRFEFKRVENKELGDDDVCLPHVHAMLQMSDRFRGNYYLSLGRMKSLLEPILGDRFDLSIVSARGFDEGGEAASRRFGYTNESGLYALYSYIFKGDVSECGDELDFELARALRPVLSNKNRRFALGCFRGKGLFKYVGFSTEGGAEDGELVRTEQWNGAEGEWEVKSEHFHDTEKEKEARRRGREKARERLQQQEQERLELERRAQEYKNKGGGCGDSATGQPVGAPFSEGGNRVLEALEAFDNNVAADKVRADAANKRYRLRGLLRFEQLIKPVIRSVKTVIKQKRTYVSLRVRFCFVSQLIQGLGRVVTRTFYELPRPRDDCAASTEIYA